MTLTPQQRLEAYEWAKEQLTQPDSGHIGVCHGLDEYLESKMGIYHEEIEDLPLYFPEFLAQKPQYIKGVYWWEECDERLAALDRAIELVKEKI